MAKTYIIQVKKKKKKKNDYRITPVIRPGPYIGYKAHPGFKKREFCSDIKPGPYFSVIRPTFRYKAHPGPYNGTGGPYNGTGGPYIGTGGPYNGTDGPYNEYVCVSTHIQSVMLGCF